MPFPFPAAPVIETPRLILRADRAEDFDDFATLWADAAVTRFIGGKPFTRTESWTRFLRNAGLWPVLGYGYWAIEDRSTGAYRGNIGFADFERGIDSIRGVPEAGWVLHPQAHGQGLATEIVGAITRWADANLPHPETACIIDPGNVPSIRVAEKNGFVAQGLVDFAGGTTRVFKRARR
ncbi:GNAT family N-acetyltransferase [Sphingomonas sp. LaA6.9]|uniref:GNAT family N-acetyltransferase n=1 Tax=Sphingomonas sp. LaA6.9 TaxID=2919914 RepID=UPI001F4F3FDF|nr:GNAT family N-acetyltransferase [Sphingomonas sp. LaA6.9]MCJ8158264.1 GNAT family N-acetyltransferase [Sphingomonas sp. LaA6.9]